MNIKYLSLCLVGTLGMLKSVLCYYYHKSKPIPQYFMFNAQK